MKTILLGLALVVSTSTAFAQRYASSKTYSVESFACDSTKDGDEAAINFFGTLYNLKLTLSGVELTKSFYYSTKYPQLVALAGNGLIEDGELLYQATYRINSKSNGKLVLELILIQNADKMEKIGLTPTYRVGQIEEYEYSYNAAGKLSLRSLTPTDTMVCEMVNYSMVLK